MIDNDRDYLFFVIIVGFTLLAFLVLALLVTFIPVDASNGVVLKPGRIMADSCAESAEIPIINWTAKGWLQQVTLHQTGGCHLRGTFDASLPGLYCTGIGTLDGADWVPDECMTVKPQKAVKFRSIWKYRYQP